MACEILVRHLDVSHCFKQLLDKVFAKSCVSADGSCAWDVVAVKGITCMKQIKVKILATLKINILDTIRSLECLVRDSLLFFMSGQIKAISV